MKRILLICILLSLCISLCGCDDGEYVTVYTDWTIYDKNYIPATPDTGGHWGYSFGEGGGLMYIGGNSGSPAVYEFFLRREDEDGNVRTATVSVSQDVYASYEVGETYTTSECRYVRTEVEK